ncbi:hypothetical protein DNTS_022962 [Danionella cerebrum]|uniref:Uncharacterized protein n=1 Tax=Danionella cerebrum TaxID=2873325 RepID=A0A553RHE0_9TELE|nr:hypothetical protein DNTS_022962 [Danionella translucida]
MEDINALISSCEAPQPPFLMIQGFRRQRNSEEEVDSKQTHGLQPTVTAWRLKNTHRQGPKEVPLHNRNGPDFPKQPRIKLDAADSCEPWRKNIIISVYHDKGVIKSVFNRRLEDANQSNQDTMSFRMIRDLHCCSKMI